MSVEERKHVRARLIRRRELSDDGCWIWLGSQTTQGYGSIWFQGGMRRVHRVAYEAWIGPIPEGLVLDHLCRVKICFNPEHLEPVTIRENTTRGDLATGQRNNNGRKTHCPRGHAYEGDNLYLNPNGARACRECQRIWWKEHPEASTLYSRQRRARLKAEAAAS